jgi:PAS domain S-box-containing protein
MARQIPSHPDPTSTDGVNRMLADAARLEALVESSEDAIMSGSVDGLVTSWNKAAERTFGYTAEEAIGRTPGSLLIPPGEHDDTAELITRAAAGESLVGLRVRRWRKNRTPVDIAITVSPIRDAAGTFLGTSVISRDVSRELEAGRRLLDAERRYRTLVEQIPVVIYDWGVKGDIHHTTENFVSPQIEAMLGYSPREWMDDPTLWLARVHEDDRARVEAATTRSIEQAAPLTIEYRMLAKDGHVVWIRDDSLVLERDAQGRSSLIQGVFVDITAENLAEEAARVAAEEKTQLIQLLAHELFTPITSIQGAALTLSSLGDKLSAEELRGLALGVSRGATRLRRLVHNLDAAAKLDRSDTLVSGRSWSVGEILDLALRDFRFESEAGDIALSIDGELATRTTVVDLPLAAQALGVVIENALDYANGQPIDIGFQDGADGMRICVSDHGPGVPSEEREHIFELFTQVDSSDTRGHEGLGVGLFLGRRVMRLHGGELEYAERPDGGSRFTLRFAPDTTNGQITGQD